MKKILVYSLVFVFSFSVVSFAMAKGGDDNEDEVRYEKGISLPPQGSIDPVLFERLKKEHERQIEARRNGMSTLNSNEDDGDDNDDIDDNEEEEDDDLNDDNGGLRNRPFVVPQGSIDWSNKPVDGVNRQSEIGKEGKAEMKGIIKGNLDKKMRGYFVERLSAITNRFDKIITRIQTRADELKTQGKDTAKAQSFIDSAKTTLEDFKTQLAQNREDLLNKTITREAFVTATKAIQDLLKSVQQDLKSALFELKGIDSDYASNVTDDKTSDQGSGDSAQQ